MNNIAQAKEEERKMRKNQSGKEDTKRMSIALNAISKSLGIPKKTPRDEILGKLAAEGERCFHPIRASDSQEAKASCLSVRLHKEREEN